MSATGYEPGWHGLAAGDLRALGYLHAQEVGSSELARLHLAGFPQGLLLPVAGQPDAAALRQQMDTLLGAMHSLPDAERAVLDNQLAADYAAIYLTHAHRASPFESVWLDEDQLMLQGPTFAVRAFYRAYGLQVADWRSRPDDHLTHELDFVATMLERAEPEAALGFLEQHLLQWLPQFAHRVAQRADMLFYATLALLTLEACQQCASRLRAEGHVPARVEAEPPVCGSAVSA